MTITHLVSAAAGGTVSSATTSAINTTGATLIIAWLGRFRTGDVPAPTFTDSAGNTWTAITDRQSTNSRGLFYYRLNPTTSASHTFTFSSASAVFFPSISVAAFAGPIVFGVEVGATTTSSASGQPGAIVPTSNGALLVAGETFSAVGTQAASGYTVSAQQNFNGSSTLGSAIAYLIQTTAASVNPTWSGSTCDRAMGHAVFYDNTSLVSGTASVVDTYNQTIQVTATAASGGTSPYTYQWERSTSSGTGYSNVSGATSLSLTDTGLTNGTTYYYRIKSTDSAGSPATVTSNEISSAPFVSTTYAVDNSLLTFSPYNWRKSGSTYAETNNPGAYLKFKFSGDAVSLLLDTTINTSLTAGNYPALTVQINNGAHVRTQLTSGQNTLLLATGLGAGTGPHTAIIYVDAAWYASDRWTTPASAVRVTGVRTTTGTVTVADVYTDSCIIYGDSNTEGYEANGSGVSVANQKAVYALGVLIGRALHCEVGVVGFASQGWATTGGGNVPTFANAWNLYSAGQSRLVSSLLSPAPKYVVISHGQNDGASNIVSSATSTVNAIKAAAPNATVCLCVPQTQGQLANLTSVAAATGATLIDPGEPFNVSPWGSTHMNSAGQGRYSAICAGKILIETATGGTNTDLWDSLKTIARDNGLELIEQ